MANYRRDARTRSETPAQQEPSTYLQPPPDAERNPILAHSSAPYQQSCSTSHNPGLTIYAQRSPRCAIKHTPISYDHLLQHEAQRLGRAPKPSTEPSSLNHPASMFPPERDGDYVGLGRFRHPKDVDRRWVVERLAKELENKYNLFYTKGMYDLLGHHPLVTQNPDMNVLSASVISEFGRRDLPGFAKPEPMSSTITVGADGCVTVRGFTVGQDPLQAVAHALKNASCGEQPFIMKDATPKIMQGTEVVKNASAGKDAKAELGTSEDRKMPAKDERHDSGAAMGSSLYSRRKPEQPRRDSALAKTIRDSRGSSGVSVYRAAMRRAMSDSPAYQKGDNPAGHARNKSESPQRRIVHVSKEGADEAIASDSEDDMLDDEEEAEMLALQRSRKTRSVIFEDGNDEAADNGTNSIVDDGVNRNDRDEDSDDDDLVTTEESQPTSAENSLPTGARPCRDHPHLYQVQTRDGPILLNRAKMEAGKRMLVELKQAQRVRAPSIDTSPREPQQGRARSQSRCRPKKQRTLSDKKASHTIQRKPKMEQPGKSIRFAESDKPY